MARRLTDLDRLAALLRRHGVTEYVQQDGERTTRLVLAALPSAATPRATEDKKSAEPKRVNAVDAALALS